MARRHNAMSSQSTTTHTITIFDSNGSHMNNHKVTVNAGGDCGGDGGGGAHAYKEPKLYEIHPQHSSARPLSEAVRVRHRYKIFEHKALDEKVEDGEKTIKCNHKILEICANIFLSVLLLNLTDIFSHFLQAAHRVFLSRH